LTDLKWVLATIAMLIALSAGAIAGGFAFKNDAFTSIEKEWHYDAILYNPGIAEEQVLQSVTLAETLHYRFKMDDQFLYFSQSELAADPPLVTDWATYETIRPGPLPANIEMGEDGYQLIPDNWVAALDTINPAFAGTRTAQILSLEDFEKTAG